MTTASAAEPDDSLPTFLVIGAMKAGTTSLHRYLGAHPDVFMPDHKEVEFFSEEREWSRGVGWYRTLFQPGRTAIARGEASTGYTKLPRFPAAADRMHAVVPGAQLVYLVREPIERMRSHYVHNVLRGLEDRAIDEALLSGEHYLPVSRYFAQLQRYRDRFADAQILVVATEDLRARRQDTVSGILSFIGVDPRRGTATLDEEHHRSESRLALRGGFKALARWRALEVLRERAPRPIAAVGRRLAARPAPAIDAHIGPELRKRLGDALHDDVEQLRRYLGGLPGGWESESEAPD